MDPISLTVATLVAGGFLAEAGSGAWRTSTRMADFLRRKFGGDQVAISALQGCEASPSDEASRGDLSLAVDRHLVSNSDFRDELLNLLAKEGHPQSANNGGITVTDQANVGKAVQINRVQGDVTF